LIAEKIARDIAYGIIATMTILDLVSPGIKLELIEIVAIFDCLASQSISRNEISTLNFAFVLFIYE